MKTYFKVCYIMVLVCAFFLISQSINAQTQETKITFKVNDKEINSKSFKVRIYDSQSEEKFLDLETKDNKILISPEIAKFENFDIHISYGKYKLIILEGNKHYFDYEWIIYAVDPPCKSTSECENDLPGKILKMLYYINFKPPNSEGGTIEIVKMYENQK